MSEKIPKEIPEVPEPKAPKEVPEVPKPEVPKELKPKKVEKIRKGKKWIEVEVQDEKKKGPFKYVKFVDEDGLETWWITVE